jgi:hypothetical protein
MVVFSIGGSLMISNNDIEQYMKSLQQGNLEAFDEIYQATYKSVFYVI